MLIALTPFEQVTMDRKTLLGSFVRHLLMLHALADKSWTMEPQVDPACNFVLPSSTGTISSPNYPNVYPRNKVCQWTITMPKNEKINLKFQHFDVEAGSNDNVCDQDYVEVIDGDSFRRGRFCNNFRPPVNLLSASNVFRVIFKSNEDGKSGRFFIEYDKKPCGGQLGGLEGMIHSPNYPHPYPTGRKCTWQITVPSSKMITLTFDTFDLNKDSKCGLDYLIVRDGPNETSSEIGHFCSTQPPEHSIRSTGQAISVEFSSYSDGNGMGFKVHYKAHSQCGGLLTSDSGKFTSVGYATPHQHQKQDCVWSIKVSPEKVISLTFESLDIDTIQHSDDSCDTDYIAVYDVQGSATRLHKKICSSLSEPLNIISQGRELHVELHTSTANTSNGFFASYYAVSADNPYIGCFVMAKEVLFTCDNGHIVHCKWKCDGTDECGDRSDESKCPTPTLESNTNNQLHDYVTIILSVTASALGTVCIGCVIERIRRKCRGNSRRRRIRRFRRHRTSDTVPLAPGSEPSSPPPPYEDTTPSHAGVSVLSPILQDTAAQVVDIPSVEDLVISTTTTNPALLGNLSSNPEVLETDVQI